MVTYYWDSDKVEVYLDLAEIVHYKSLLGLDDLEQIVSLFNCLYLACFLAKSGISLGGERLGMDSIFGIDENKGINLGSFLNVSDVSFLVYIFL
jgi:hypothetical protein